MSVIIRTRRDTAANWAANNPTLDPGEVGLETDTGQTKTGPGAWNTLDYDFEILLATNPRTPGNNKYYGTNGSGVWGEYDLPSGGGGGTAVDDLQAVFTALGSPIKGHTAGMPIPLATAAVALSDNALRLQPVVVKEAMSISGIKYIIRANGVFTGDNENAVSLFSYSAGVLTRVAISANDPAIFSPGSSNVLVTVPFTTPYSAAPGVYFTGVLYNNSAQTTAPTIQGSSSTGSVPVSTMDFSNSAKIYGNLSGQNTTPSSINMSAVSTITTVLSVFIY